MISIKLPKSSGDTPGKHADYSSLESFAGFCNITGYLLMIGAIAGSVYAAFSLEYWGRILPLLIGVLGGFAALALFLALGAMLRAQAAIIASTTRLMETIGKAEEQTGGKD